MRDEQVERILNELARTRESFDAATETFNTAIEHIQWNRRNTIIQYFLIFLVVCMLGMGSIYYLNEKHANCVRGNDLRVAIVDAIDSNARAIGTALAVVSNAPDAKFKEYMEVYNQQDKPLALETRKC